MIEHNRPAACALAIALAAGLPAAASAQSMLDGLKEKAAKAAEKVGQTAGSAAEAVGKATNAVVEHANETVESTKEDLRDEPTPVETRAKLDAIADVALQRLFADEPDTKALFASSAGYAVFDTRQAAYVVTAGYGRGVAVNLDSGERTYMKMGSGGVGISLGFGGFDSQVVILFESAFAFNKFVVQGLDATAEAGTMTGEGKDQLALHFEDGRAVFVLTQQGWKVSAKLSGTRYWPDVALN
jgi:S1-C subfamily serine protease